jgi:Tfp pilus assembly protein PilN
MITLNLIPPTAKRNLKLTQVYKIIKDLIIFILFLTIFVAIILLLIKMALQNNFNKVVTESTLTTKYANIFNKDVKKFNEYLSAVDKIQQDYIPWSKFLVNLTKLIPENINIKNLDIDSNKISITGWAKSRDELLLFKNNLENSELFNGVNIPLENLLQKDNVDFNIKASIKLDKLKVYGN